MRILSIDMGIRNLAYAHLRVSPLRDGKAAGKAKKDGQEGGHSVRLEAWNRLAVSSFSVEEAGCSGDGIGSVIALDKFNGGIPSTTRPTDAPTTTKSKSKSPAARALMGISGDSPIPTETEITNQAKEIIKKESFAPDIYASHAYTLITGLLSTYKPTHILIERQRFRTGGGSAVQEWTIRVGVFEAMLYAVLQTLKSESRRRSMTQLGTKSKGDGTADEMDVANITVLGVDPRRVANYWAESVTGAKLKNKTRSKEGKKIKIGVIKSALSDLGPRLGGGGSSSAFTMGQSSMQIILEENAQVQEVARAYLEKLNRKKKGAAVGSKTTAKKQKTKAAKKTEELDEPEGSAKTTDIDIGKLDDLADCFLQGLTWLGWWDMRARIAKGGLDAVPFDDFKLV